MPTSHLAIDLGASSGRAMLGVLDGDPLKLQLEEVHRFEHTPLESPAGPVWDFTGIVNHIYEGLRAGAVAAKQFGIELTSIGVDTWGVDWGIVDRQGELVGIPHCYRDPANALARDRVVEAIEGGAETIYHRSGIQLQSFNTLFQLVARRDASPELFIKEGTLVFLPDLFHYWLSGKRSTERTIASTSSMLSIETGGWDHELLEQLDLPTGVLGEIVEPGARLGKLRPELAQNLGVSPTTEVVVPAAHDTASAIAAVPAVDSKLGSWAYLSSGTWSLLGMELEQPIATSAALAAGFTNELGVNGTVRFLRNIGGLWLLQELRRDLQRRDQQFSFAELAELAGASEPFRTFVDPNAVDLASPGGSIDKLRAHAQRSDQPEPDTPGQLARCCLESLALCYAETIDSLEEMTGSHVETLYAVGGGVQNQLLNQLTASAIGRPLITGPIEATAIGNLLVQAMGVGVVGSHDDLRGIVKRSFPVNHVTSSTNYDWSEARSRYNRITSVRT